MKTLLKEFLLLMSATTLPVSLSVLINMSTTPKLVIHKGMIILVDAPTAVRTYVIGLKLR